MEEKLQSRSIHIVVFLLILILSLIVGFIWPDLHSKPSDLMSFLGFWITVFGLLVAIVEIIRLGYTSKGIIRAADAAFNDLKLQMELQEVRSCLEIINISISDLNANKQIPLVLISRIKQVYISVFPTEIKTSGTTQHHSMLIVNSYAHVNSSKRSPKASQYLKTTPPEIHDDHEPKKKPVDNNAPNEHKHKATLDALNTIHDELSMYAASKQSYKEVTP